ncbi:MAG: NADH:ubiquinone reductase (Na(+)-transporting) subunit C [Cytophagales bacterium]|nr:NADH:ubiquinone reductase (Na(+)-transporting) subunit C [Cytophagales bacterium]
MLTIVLGGLLSMANQGLKPKQQRSVELDTKKKILGSVTDLGKKKGQEVLDLYKETIESSVYDIEGNIIETDEKGAQIIAENVNIAKNFKKPAEQRLYPVFIYHAPGNKEAIEAYILPVFGKGLWGPIYGFVALDTDLNTIKGISLDHDKETPGLGARITGKDIQARYVGKKIFNESGNLVSVSMLKGESNTQEALDAHHIDGMSGATITGKGVNNMLLDYFGYYQKFMEKKGTATNKVASL